MGDLSQKFNLSLINVGIGLSRNNIIVPPGIMENIQNCNIHELGLGKRGGSSIFDNISGNPRLTGLKQFISSEGDRHIIRTTDDGKIYKDKDNTIKTGLSTVRGGEVLTETDFITHDNWDVTGAFVDVASKLDYVDIPSSGTATQQSANFLRTVKPNTVYEFIYKVSGLAGAALTCNITTAIASGATALTLSAGVQTTQFTTNASPGDFVLSVTGSSGGGTDLFILDNVSLREVINPIFDLSVYNEHLLMTNGVDVPQLFRGLRFLQPPAALIVGNADNGAGNLDNDIYSYKFTFVNSSGETTGSPVSNEVDVADNSLDGQVKVNFLPIGPSEIVSRKIYRTEGGGSTYKLLTTISDNTTIDFIDNISDDDLGVTIPSENTAATGSATTELGDQGIAVPGVLTPTLTGPGALKAVLAGDGAGNVNTGTHSYRVIFVDDEGVHSVSGTTSNVITVANSGVDGQVDLTDIPLGPPGTVVREIFRTIAGDTGNYFELVEIGDNTTTSFTDNVDDTDLGSDVVSNGGFDGAGTGWTATGNITVGAGTATYNSAGVGAGTVFQLVQTMARPPEESHAYELSYDISNMSGPDEAAISSFNILGFDEAGAIALDTGDGTHTKVLISASPVASITFSVVTSAASNWDLDNVLIREIPTVGEVIGIGDYTYKTVFLNVYGETTGSLESEIITTVAENGEVTLSDIPTGPDGVIARKIYRSLISPTTAPVGALAGLGAGNLEEDVYSYKVTFVNAAGESAGSPVSNEITVVDNSADGQIALTGVSVGPTGTTARRIYRTEGGGSVYKFLFNRPDNVTTTFNDNIGDGGLGDEIASSVHHLVATIPDNTTLTYTDRIGDVSLGAIIPTSNTAAARPNDWVEGNNPLWGFEHSAGNTEGVIFGGAPKNKNDIYIIPDGSFDASQENIRFFRLNTGDNNGLVGGMEFGNRPIVFTRKDPFIIDKTDLNPDNWTYRKAQWSGGAISQQTIVKVINDVHIMAPDGNIYKLSTTEKFGDYETASLTRATPDKLFDFNKWIVENVDFNYADQFHGEYVPELRAVRWWVVRQGESTVDTAMVYFIDFDRWVIQDNHASNSGFSASVSTIVEETDGSQTVYTGDYSGNVWKLDQTARNDNSNGYAAGFTTNEMLLPFEKFEDRREFDKFVGIYEEHASQDFTVSAFGDDGVETGPGTIDMTANYNDFKITQTNKRAVKLQMFNNAANEDFFIMGLTIFVKNLN